MPTEDPLNAQQLRRVLEAFKQAIEASPKERHRVLADLCKHDPQTRAFVERMLLMDPETSPEPDPLLPGRSVDVAAGQRMEKGQTDRSTPQEQ